MAPEGLKDKAARRLPKDRSVAIEGVFRPNERIRSLPAVFQAPDQVVLLKCSECAESMNSTWFWKHPGNGGMMVTQPAGTRWERDVLGFLWMARTPSWITLISLTFALTSAEGPGVLSAVAMVFALTIGNGPGVQSASPSRPEEKCTETVAKPAISTPRSG